MTLPAPIDDEACRVFQRTAEMAGRKWNAAIMMGLAQGLTRFSQLRANIVGLSDRMLATRLRELEVSGIVRREVTPTTPVQVRYSLTTGGAELIRVLHPLVDWARRWESVSAGAEPSTQG